MNYTFFLFCRMFSPNYNQFIHYRVRSRNLLFFIASLWCGYVYGGILQGSHIIYDETTVVTLEDHHTAGTSSSNNKQVTDVVQALQDTGDYRVGNMHIFWEKVTTTDVNPDDERGYEFLARAPYKEMLRHLEASLITSGLSTVTIEDVEIRQIGGLANDMIAMPKLSEMLYPENCYFTCKHQPTRMRCCDITFGHIIDEFTTWLSYVERFRKKNENMLNFGAFDTYLSEAKEYFDEFCQLFKTDGISLDDTVLKTVGAWSAERDSSVDVKEWNYKLWKLSSTIGSALSGLFDLYLFCRICEHRGNYLTLVVGAHHARQVKSMLFEQGAHEKLQFNNFIGRADSEQTLLSLYELSALLKGFCWFKYMGETYLKPIKESYIEPVVMNLILGIVYVRALFEPRGDDDK